MAASADTSRRVDFATGADKSRRVDLAARADKSRQVDTSKQVDSSASRHVKIGQLSCHSTRLDWLTWAREPIHLDGSTAVRANTSNGWTWSPKQTCLDGLSSLLEQTSLQLEPTSLDKLTRQNGSTHCHSTRLDGSTWPLEPIRLDGSTLPLEPIRLDWLTWSPEPKSLDGLTWLPEPTSPRWVNLAARANKSTTGANKSRQVDLVARDDKSRQVNASERVNSAASRHI